MKIYVDGYPHGLMKGHIIKLLEFFPEDDDERGTRITMFENVSTGSTWKSWIRGVGMSRNKENFQEPVVGKVQAIYEVEGLQNAYNIDILEGKVNEDHVFVQAGDKQKGKDALKSIFQNELSTYLKICDPYVCPETLDILQDVPTTIDIMILTNKVNDKSAFITKLTKMNSKHKIKVRKMSDKLHARYILTQGIGWIIDHSLKNFGEKDAFLSKLDSSVDHETNFDSRWVNAVPI